MGSLALLLICSAVMVIMAAFADSDERQDAITSALALIAGYMIYGSTWTALSPDIIIYKMTNISMDYVDIWLLVDGFTAAIIATIAMGRWWGSVIWLSLILQCCTHAVFQWGLMPFEPKAYTTNVLFAVQMAVFITLGGPRFTDFIKSKLNSLPPLSPKGMFGFKRRG